MKKLIALMLSIFTILLMSTSAFAFSGGGISGGVNGDGDFTGGGFSGGSRLSSVFGSSPPASSSLSTMLSYEALNNLTANINLGISLGEIEILDGNIQAVTVTKRTDWNAYVITGVYNGNTYVIVNASGGRYYSPINEGYTISAIAGATGYCLTDRPAGTTGNGYLGDLLVTQDNLATIHGIVDGLGGVADYYMVLRIVNGEYRYYIMCTYPNRQQYFVCNTSGQLFYALRDEVTDDGGDIGGGSTFDPTEVITAINSVYSAINSMNSNLGTRLANILNATNGIGVSVENLVANVVTGFTGVQEQLSTLNSYFTDLSGLFPVQETITLLGSDTRVAWDSADRITNVTTAGFNGDLIVKERPGDLVDESGYEKVTINETEYSLYNDNNGYRRIKAMNEYPDTGTAVPYDTLFYFPFDGTLSSSVGNITLTDYGSGSYAAGVNGDAFVFNGGFLQYPDSGMPANSSTQLSFSFWFKIPSFPTDVRYLYQFEVGSSDGVSVSIGTDGTLRYHISGSNYNYNYDSTGKVVLNEWMQAAVCFDGAAFYCFLNGNLDVVQPITSNDSLEFDGGLIFGSHYMDGLPAGSMLDELIFINGSCLWTSNFDPNTEAIFSSIIQDYFLPCSDQEIILNFYDTTGEQVTEHRWNQYTVNTSRLPYGYTELDSIRSSGTQCIDTGYMPNQNTKVVATAEWLSTSDYPMLCGAYESNDNQYAIFFSGGYHAWVASKDIIYSTSNLGLVDVSLDNSSFSVNGRSFATNGSNFSSSLSLYLFAIHQNNGIYYHSSMVFYSMQIYDNGTLVRDFVPCKNPSNAVGLYDLVNGQFYGNSGTGSFTAGNEVSNGSGIGQLVGVVSSTNSNAYPNDGIQGDFYYEYIGAYTEYPSFSQTLSPTDVNGNAITMGRLEDDFSEIYMDISTMMWYCHDPQTQTEILLSSANQDIMNDTIYVRQNYTMLPADQITADALQNLLPVDSPVYLDMPEGAKLTITYDHYTGWFRMMYILMDKQTKLLSDLDIVNETIINVENTVIDITNNNPAYNVFYITKTDGTTESVGDAAKDAAVFVGDVLSMFYRLVFDDALDNAGVIQDFEDVLTTTNTGVNVW